VLLEETIHELGSFEVKVRLHSEVIATIALTVEPFQE
jgi:ribosomal protein L9